VRKVLFKSNTAALPLPPNSGQIEPEKTSVLKPKPALTEESIGHI